MGLSKRHLSSQRAPLHFDPSELARALEARCEEVQFALLMGSAKDGHVEVGSDIDVALYVESRPSLELLSRVSGLVSEFAPGAHCDVGLLKNAEPVYRYEALKGRLLFARDLETYVRFFSLTCREYESQIADYERQHRYRTGAA